MAEPQAYRLLWSSDARNALVRMSKIAAPSVKQQVADSIKFFVDRLTAEPSTVGEPYRSRGNITESHAVLGFISIDFAVDAMHSLVLVRKVHALSGHGIDDDSQ